MSFVPARFCSLQILFGRQSAVRSLLFAAALTATAESLLSAQTPGEIDPSFVITHRLELDDAPQGYKTFRDKEDNCIKVVLRP